MNFKARQFYQSHHLMKSVRMHRLSPKTAPFSRIDRYNSPTIRRLVIYQFYKNAHFITFFISVIYIIHKKCEHFKCPVLELLIQKG